MINQARGMGCGARCVPSCRRKSYRSSGPYNPDVRHILIKDSSKHYLMPFPLHAEREKMTWVKVFDRVYF